MLPKSITLVRNSNQARGLGSYAIDFLSGKYPLPSEIVLARVEQFHLDSVACAVSAIALGANAPTVLRKEALQYRQSATAAKGATCFGSSVGVAPEKAVLANCAAVREWDANGTNFGYNPELHATAGEFGHNDYYPVVVAAAQVAGLDGRQLMLGMLLLDEIRGRLAEVFSLKDYNIDHVVHGAIASAAVYGAMVGATAQQIESAIGLLVAHYVPYRAIRSGHQLSDSKGASAAFSAEMAVLSVRRAVEGFVGPADIFRNRQALFCLCQPAPSPEESPFDLSLTTSGERFAVMGMHFKLGLYEHQSAGAIQGLLNLLGKYPQLLTSQRLPTRVRITIYEPAYGIICDPAKRDPQTRQTADHSILYIVAALLEKAWRLQKAGWKELMLMPADYAPQRLRDSTIRQLIDRIEVVHGGPEYDTKYPDGIPTSLELEHDEVGVVSSGLVMYPAGHVRNNTAPLEELLDYKFHQLAARGVTKSNELAARFKDLSRASSEEVAALYTFDIDK
jgi:2-methylcitrate dehydratase